MLIDDLIQRIHVLQDALKARTWQDPESERAAERGFDQLRDALYIERSVVRAFTAYEEIAERASRVREEVEIDGAGCIVDASDISPAFRRLPGAERLYQEHVGAEIPPGAWDAFCEAFEDSASEWNEHGFTLVWEDGCLFVTGPQWTPEGD